MVRYQIDVSEDLQRAVVAYATDRALAPNVAVSAVVLDYFQTVLDAMQAREAKALAQQQADAALLLAFAAAEGTQTKTEILALVKP